MNTAFFTICSLSFAVATEALTPEKAKAELMALFERQYQSMPVTGEFVVSGTTTSAGQLAQSKTSSGQNAKQPKSEAAIRKLECRWSMDRSRELLDTLSTSEGASWYFLQKGDSILHGRTKKNHNLEKNRSIPIWRPASFGVMNPAMMRWSDEFKEEGDYVFSGSQDERIVTLRFSVVKGTNVAEFLVDRRTGMLQSASRALNGKVFWNLIVEKYYTEGKNAFPSSASIELRHDITGELIRRETMQSKSVKFPRSNEEIAEAFELDIPKNALVADRFLKGATHTDTKLSAKTIIDQPDKLRLKPYVQKQLDVNEVSTTVGKADDSGFNYRALLISVAASSVVVLVATFVYKKRTSTTPS